MPEIANRKKSLNKGIQKERNSKANRSETKMEFNSKLINFIYIKTFKSHENNIKNNISFRDFYRYVWA